MRFPGDAARLRLGALALVAGLVLALRALAPDPGMRRESLLLVALGLGYGHQLGALRFGRRSRPKLEWLLLGLTTLTAALVSALVLTSAAAVWLLALLAWLGAWHVLENDVALGCAPVDSRRLPPLARRCWLHLALIAVSALVVALAALAPGGAAHGVALGVPAWLAVWTPEEIIAVLLLYHSVTWLGRAMAPSARARAPILLVHALPLVVLAAASALVPAGYAWVASPAAYLFLSAAHAVHTCCERGLEAA